MRLLVVIIVLWSSVCLAAPNPTSVQSIVSDGQTMVIVGTGFGTKPNAAPKSFLKANIEAGTPGAMLSAPNYINVRDPVKYYSGDKHSGSQSVRVFVTGEDVGFTNSATYDFGASVSEVYFTAWLKLQKSGACSKFQWKNWRLGQKSNLNYMAGYTDGTGVLGDTWWPWSSNSPAILTYVDGSSVPESRWYILSNSFLYDEWQRVEAIYKKSSPNTANGFVYWNRIGFGNQLNDDNPSGNTPHSACVNTNSVDDFWRYFYWGAYYGNLDGCDSTNSSFTATYDDVYIDSTQARVELGNKSTWAARFDSGAIFEPQPPIRWDSTGTRIDVTLNAAASFSADSTAYIYVVDSAGVANANGLEVTIGQSSTPQVPTCFDGYMNGDETGVDCGGSCEACPTPDVCGEDHLELCTTSELCTGAGLNWCPSGCQVAACPDPGDTAWIEMHGIEAFISD